MSEKFSVLLADDHTLFREGLAELIGLDTGFVVVGQAETGYAALDLVDRMRPDLLILDAQMPGPGAEAVIEQVARIAAGTRVVVVTMYDDLALTARLLARGAAAYLVKNTSIEELVAVLRAAGRGRTQVLLPVPRGELARGGGSAARSVLTVRETDVLELLAKGYSNARMAAVLGIAEATVKRHLTNVYGKLGAISRVDALRLAYELALIRPGAPAQATPTETADIPEYSAP
jgi:DNA-binding NarL/FixJ family response regulator